MKKIVLLYGAMAGIIVTAMMVLAVYRCYHHPDFESQMLIGYLGMALGFIFIYFGIKKYRDSINGGLISFGKAFKTGLLIALIASTMYVLGWLIYYYGFVPDFMDRYNEEVLKEARLSGMSGADLEEKAADLASFNEKYKNPLFVVLASYVEILPLGVLVSIICAFILKKRKVRNAIKSDPLN